MVPSALRSQISYLIHDLSRMRRTYFDQVLKPLGITRAQWWALDNVSRSEDKGLIQTRLATVLEVGKVSVGGVIDRLEEAGLVYRQSDDEDRRIRRIFITDRGEQLLAHIRMVVAGIDDRLFEGVDPADLAATTRVLGLLKDTLRAAMAHPEQVAPLPIGRRAPPPPDALAAE